MSGRARMALMVAVVALFLAACGGTSRSDFDEEVRARGGGLGSSLAVEAVDALRDELGDDLAFHSFTMSPGQVTVEVLVPGSVDQLDTYRYGTSGLYGGGGLSGPTPVSGVGGDDDVLRRSLFRPERIAFDDLDAVVDAAVEAAGLPGGYAQSLRVTRTGERPVITVTVDSERETVEVAFRADGTPLGEGGG